MKGALLLGVIMVSFSLASVALADANTAALWHFDENSGSIAYDSSGNGNNGTVHGATWTTGNLNNSLSFDGIDDFVEPPSFVLWHPSEVTFEAWVKPYSFPSTPPNDPISQIICHGYGGHLELGYLNTGTFTFGVWHPDVTWTWIYSKVKQPSNWYHVVGVWKDSSYIQIYVNGLLEDNISVTKPLGDPGNSYPLIIGSYCQPYKLFFNGIIDEVAIYNRTLSPEEILNHYQAGAPPTHPECNCTELTERILELENKIESLDNRVGVVESAISSLQASVQTVQDNLNRLVSFLTYLPKSLRNDMVCDYMKATNTKSLDSFGLHCEINKKKACNCKSL